MKYNNKPINIYNGIRSEIENNEGQVEQIAQSKLVAIKAYQNSKNITKPFVKPISKII